MTWIQTHSGIAFDLLCPTPEMVDPLDIAHALAHLNRYAGHAGQYSVAEHCCHIHDWLEAQDFTERHEGIALAGLLHDAHEAYVTDMPSPVKAALPKSARAGLAALSFDIDIAICRRFGLHALAFKSAAIKAADLRILNDERGALLGPPPRDWGIDPRPLGVTIHGWDAETAKGEWLARLEARDG